MVSAPTMREGSSPTGAICPEELKSWLEWAGARLIAMPDSGIRPKEYKVAWPDYAQETFQVLEFRGVAPLRANAPSSAEIPIVDEILILPNLCTKEPIRKVLHCRSLVHPVRNVYLYRWTKIAELLNVKVHRVKYWHKIGLEEVCRRADPAKVCRIRQFTQSEKFIP